MAEHDVAPLGEIHRVANWEYADATARLAATGFLPSDVGKWAKQLNDGSYWELADDSPIVWAQRTGAGVLNVDNVSDPVQAQDVGSTDNYVATLSPTPSAYKTGTHYRFKANTPNTGPCTINFNSLGAKTIKKVQGGITTDLADNDIRAGQWVDLVYDGTNMQMQSLLGNTPSSGATELDDLTDVVISSPSTDEVLKYNGSEWVNATASAGGGTFVGGGFEQYRVIGVNARPNVSTTQDTFGHSAISPFAGSAASEDDADGPWRKLNTSATTDTTAGYNFNNAGIVQTRWLPQLFVKLKTGASITNQRIWVGFFTADPTTADPVTRALGFRYDTASSDANWKAYSNDNSGGGTITDTGVVVSADTCYIFAIKVVSPSSVEFYISTNNGSSFSLVATHTTNLPPSSDGMDQHTNLRTLENVSKTFKHSYTYIRMR